MPAIGAVEAGKRFPELLDRVERGEEVVITRGGKAVARLARIEETHNEARHAGALGRLEELRARLREEGVAFSADEVLALRDEGRR